MGRYDPPSLSTIHFVIPRLVCPGCGSRLDYGILFDVPWCGCKVCSGPKTDLDSGIFIEPFTEPFIEDI